MGRRGVKVRELCKGLAETADLREDLGGGREEERERLERAEIWEGILIRCGGFGDGKICLGRRVEIEREIEAVGSWGSALGIWGCCSGDSWRVSEEFESIVGDEVEMENGGGK